MEPPPIDPRNVVLVFKHDGKEVGRKAATDPQANTWISDMARQYKGGTVDYVEDAEDAKIHRMVSSLFR